MTSASRTDASIFSRWSRWRFHLSALLIAVPLLYAPGYFHEIALSQGKKGLGERDLGEKIVGPWSVRLAEFQLGAPMPEGEGRYVKSFSLALCPACIDQVKAAYMRVGKPRNLRTAGAIFFGAPYRQSAEVQIPENARLDAEFWLTLEGWDGSLHQTTIPLAEASPDTAAWLKQRGAQ